MRCILISLGYCVRVVGLLALALGLGLGLYDWVAYILLGLLIKYLIRIIYHFFFFLFFFFFWVKSVESTNCYSSASGFFSTFYGY